MPYRRPAPAKAIPIGRERSPPLVAVTLLRRLLSFDLSTVVPLTVLACTDNRYADRNDENDQCPHPDSFRRTKTAPPKMRAPTNPCAYRAATVKVTCIVAVVPDSMTLTSTTRSG